MNNLEKAIKKVREGATANFDETIELHFNLKLDVTKVDQRIRTTTTLPHGTGSTIKVAVFSTKNIEKADLNLKKSDIKKISEGKISPGKDFDVLIAEPKFMSDIAKLGPTLGPIGLMPNPKNDTVTDDVAEAVESFKEGKIEIRTEPEAPIIHTVIGKASFSEEKLKENFMEVLKTIKQNKPVKARQGWIKSCFITSSMSKSIKVDLTDL